MSKILLTADDNMGWKRDFPVEKIGWIGKQVHRLKGGRLPIAEVASVIDQRQGRFIDTNFYYRLDGVVPEKAKEYSDFLAIQWGIGSNKAITYDQQVSIAIGNDQNYITWIILDPDDALPIVSQLALVLADPLAVCSPIAIDVEKPRSTTRCINYYELRDGILYLKSNSEYPTGIYSRVNIFEDIFPNGFPNWMQDVWQWIAQYLYVYVDGIWIEARYYEQFLKDWAWSLPPSVVSSSLYNDQYWRDQVLAWQISPKGDAEYYIAPEWIYPGQPGIKSCDLNLTIPELSVFTQKVFTKVQEPPPPPPEPECTWMFEAVRNVNYRTAPVVSASTYVGTINTGEIVLAEGLVNPRRNEFWLEINLDGSTYYTALMYYGTQFYKPI